MPLRAPDRIALFGLKRHGGAKHQFPLRQRDRLRLRVGQLDCGVQQIIRPRPEFLGDTNPGLVCGHHRDEVAISDE